MDSQAFSIDPNTPGNVICKYCHKSVKMTTSKAHLKSEAHMRLEKAAAGQASKAADEEAGANIDTKSPAKTKSPSGRSKGVK
jgi:hypothetical protein